MNDYPVRSAAHDYTVRVGHGLLSELGETLVRLQRSGRVALASDTHVLAAWGDVALASLRAADFDPLVLTLEPGEQNKTLEAAGRLYGPLIKAGFGRHDTLVAMGGGVVGDLAGFVAATYHRGMGLVQVPTTLLAQVDSSLGGKVAVDHPLGKNLVGTFYPPRAVLADTATLTTLPERERWCGLAEVVKAALIGDPALFIALERNLERVGQGTLPPTELAELVGRAVRIKAQVVSEDEHERGVRMHLNLGHTLGHALETATGYGPLTHGEAVVIGMRVAVRLSVRLGRLDPVEAERALKLLARFPRPPPVPVFPTAEALLQAAGRDKKVMGGRVRFIVLDGLGKAGIEPALLPELLEEAAALALAEL